MKRHVKEEKERKPGGQLTKSIYIFFLSNDKKEKYREGDISSEPHKKS